MTGNSEKIKRLKQRQAEKRERIKAYKEKMKKHVFYLSIVIAAISIIFLENAYKVFGSAANFLITTLSIFVIFSTGYYVAVRFLTKQREREIKIIRSKLYRLMKLQNE
ncbi:hypothetical protein AAON49_04340 [Pseudotenacibaculum sp. MALMAid0570]|uniref:hypothetical protein n=1 Tax=Pseudotenacibaculum sp. MALMAid0570 TaxID=3143938 RepID=UPI0032DF9C60